MSAALTSILVTDAHSPLAPSSAYRWVFCEGSVALEAAYPETEEDESAAEGTAAHHAGAEMLLGREPGTVAPNGVVLTEEMLDGAQMWVDDVRSIGAPASELQVEQRVYMPRIMDELVTCRDCSGAGLDLTGCSCETCAGTGKVLVQAYGTPDTWLFVPSTGTVYVWDFKFGHGVVEHFENWQLIAYVCGILDLLGIDGRNDEHIWCDLRVVQPRAYHREGRVRSWRVRASDLRGYFNRLNLAAHAAMRPGAATRTGSYCLHCNAAANCETLRKAVTHAADWLGGSSPEELPARAAGEEMELLEHLATLVKARRTARTADLSARLRRGEGVPGWCLENTTGAKAWKPEDKDKVIALGPLLGLDLAKAPAPITPTQALALAKKKGVDASVIFDYAHTPSTGQKLARDTHLLNRARAGFGVNLEQ